MELCKTDIYFFISLIFNLFLFYKFYELKKITNVKEHFAVQDDVKAAINEVYQADVDAVRNLSALAIKLQAGGLTVAGELKTDGGLTVAGKLKAVGKISTNNLDPDNMPDGWGGGIRTLDLYSSGAIATGPDGKKVNAYINSAGDGQFNEVFVNGWVRPRNNTGIYFQEHGGGWHMADPTWIRAYNGKSVLCDSTIQAKTLVSAEDTSIVRDASIGRNLTVAGDIRCNRLLIGHWIIYQRGEDLAFASWSNPEHVRHTIKK